MVWLLDSAVFLSYWLCFVIWTQLFSLLNYSVSVGVITKDALFRSIPKDFREIMHVVCKHVILQLIRRDFLGRSHKQLQVNRLCLFLEDLLYGGR